jgi:CheY-like chemotaxis protein
MDPEVLARAFDPFFTTKPPGAGSGLGLSVVDGIVSQSGGRTTLETQAGRGCSVIINLPAALGDVALLPPQKAGVAPDTPAPAATVLVVEDEAGVRELMRRMLTRAGYRVLTARDGGEGLVVSDEHHGAIDLVITDVIMPLMGGRLLAEKLRERRPALQVLFVSGYSAAALPLFEREAEKVTLLEKPFTSTEFLDTVQRMLEAVAPDVQSPSQ